MNARLHGETDSEPQPSAPNMNSHSVTERPGMYELMNGKRSNAVSARSSLAGRQPYRSPRKPTKYWDWVTSERQMFITSPEVAWLTVTPQRRSIKLMASPISLQVCRSEGTYLPGRRVPAVLTRERGPRRPPPECPPP